MMDTKTSATSALTEAVLICPMDGCTETLQPDQHFCSRHWWQVTALHRARLRRAMAAYPEGVARGTKEYRRKVAAIVRDLKGRGF